MDNYDSIDIKKYLESHYGYPHKESITPYERVNKTLNGVKPDRTPFALWVVSEIMGKLKSYLEVDKKSEVYDLLGIDCRGVEADHICKC